jgi:peptidyl-tRNA hydrolase, PTH1 family
MHKPIQLIVGLGNPGPEYAITRHNAGAWFVEKLALDNNQTLRAETKFKGLYARIHIENHDCHLLIPTTYMNLSGSAVIAVAQFYKIMPENILVAHDELDFSPGVVRLKENGGHGGHNGLRSIIEHLKTNNFLRLRIGIGHPRQNNQAAEVIDYVLHKPSKLEQEQILDGIDSACGVIKSLIAGDIQQAMKDLHS